MSDNLPAFFRSKGITFGNYPPYVLEKAKSIIEKIEGGEHFSNLRGKRLIWNRKIVSIPINPDYRIIAEETAGKLKITHVVSHSEYDKLIGKR